MALFTTLAAAAAPKLGKLIKQGKLDKATLAASTSQDWQKPVAAARPDGLYSEDNGNFTRVVNGQGYLVTPKQEKYNGIRAEFYETRQRQPQYLIDNGLLDPSAPSLGAQSPSYTSANYGNSAPPLTSASIFDVSDSRQYAKGGSGKEYSYNSQTGNIGITRPDGSFANVAATDPQYANTKQAAQTDIDAYHRVNMGQSWGGVGGQQLQAAAADPYAKMQNAIKEGDYNGATAQLVGQYLPGLASMANSDFGQQQLDYYRQTTLSYEQALPLARQYLQGQYLAAAENSADAAAQRLDRAGIYDSLYGQALAMDAEQNARQSIDQEATALAAQLVGFNRQQAMDLLQLNQNALDTQFAARESSMNYVLRLVQQLAAQAEAERNDAARQGLWEIENRMRQGLLSEGEALYLLRNLLS